MNSLVPYRLCLLTCITLFFSCQTTSDSDAKNGLIQEVEEPIEKKEHLNVEQRVRDKLLSYYQDLSKESINTSQYFAPQVEQFFSQSQLSQDQVQKSLQNGFKAVEDRIIQLDKSSLQVQREGEGYVATFKGKVSFTRTQDKSRHEESFQNKVTLNNDLMITRYESLASSQESDPPKSTRTLAEETTTPLSEDEELAVALGRFLKAWDTEDMQAQKSFIHPKRGFVYITRPGAMDNVFTGKSFDAAFEEAYTPWVPGMMKKAQCQAAFESIPEYDCENFSKNGCFISPVTDYSRASYLINVLQESELGKFSDQLIKEVDQVEAMVSHQVVITAQSISMCWGKTNGKWYLLVLDIATYDCSA